MFANVLIVTPKSGVMLGYNHISVHANHREMVRFGSKSEPAFISISGTLQSWITELGDLRDVVREQEGQRTNRERRLSEIAPPEYLQDSDNELLPPAERQITREDKINAPRLLAFPEMGLRQVSVDKAARDTCQWLFDDSRFSSWVNFQNVEQSHGLLWIKGKPGSGKSTLMKHAYERLGAEPFDTPKALRMCYFFNARGAELERSPVGLYRTLLYQLCSKSGDVYKRLVKVYKRKKMQNEDAEVTWHLAELQTLFHDVIAYPSLPLLEIFVDALDECNEDDVRRVVRSFADSAANAMSKKQRLRICWSSRHYPHISIKHGTELRMEDLNRTDIAKYVQQQLETSSVLSSDALFAEEIVSKAHGVFLWTVLVLKRLLKAYDQGRPIRELHEILQRTPDELNKLFASIFATLDPELQDDTLHLVYWVLFARIPLYLDSLQIALVFSSKNTPISLASWASSLRGPERLHASLDDRNAHFRRFITERSGGLFEVVSPTKEQRQKEYHNPIEESGDPKLWSDRSPRTINPKFWNISNIEKECLIDPSAYAQSDQYSVPSWRDILTKLETETSFVQVIHESVRDFLLGDSSPFSRNSDSFADESNYALFQSCAKFLQCRELSCALPVFQHRKQFPITVPQLVKDGDAWMNSSFTAYARACVWEHLRRSITNDYSLLSLKGQADFARATFKQWWSLELCAGNSEVTGSSAVIVLDRKELTMKQRWLQQCSRLVGYGILTLEDAIQDRDCAENFHQGLLTLLFNNTPQQSGRPSECSFVAASHHELDRLVNVFVQHGIAIDCVDLRGHTALLEAVRGNHTTTVRLLLEKGANTESSSLWIDSPLFAAAKLGSLAIVKLLLMYGADAHYRNWANETPIHNAAAGGHVSCARALIHRRVDIDHPDQYLETPLFKAIKTNQVSTAELFLDSGANIEALNKLGNSPLIESARCGSFSVTRLLLARGANHEVTGWFGTTALYWAAVSGHEDITLALMRAGATILLGVEKVSVEDDFRDADLSDDLDDVVSEDSDLANIDKSSKDSLESVNAQISKNSYNN